MLWYLARLWRGRGAKGGAANGRDLEAGAKDRIAIAAAEEGRKEGKKERMEAMRARHAQ